MKVIISYKKMPASDGVNERVEKKLAKLERYFHTDVTAHVVMSVEKDRNIFEVTISHEGMFYRAQEAASDMFKAMDAAVEALIRQIRKNRTRLEKRLREGAFEVAPQQEAEHEEGEFAIVRSKQFFLKPMDAEEAILQMNMIGHEFFLFRSAENDRPCVVYKRKNGGYGLIETL